MFDFLTSIIVTVIFAFVKFEAFWNQMLFYMP